ncbi:hypothetical protein SAMN02910353_01027 [Ruminococcus sp. YRD2003]|uniref:hypothetical protein n=1 Tax=Ruminococcus sp. YRD2003 TaxID=1452313 RepID=UPI0008B7F076|nr:hypothetical protein SAMN02910353_01027 [Ruminococcus flavefaciens]
MELEEEFSRNRAEMKRIKRVSTTAALFYVLFSCYVLFELFYSIMVTPFFLLAALLVAAASVTGFLGVYKKDNRFIIASMVLIAVHAIAFELLVGVDLLGVALTLIMNGGFMICPIKMINANKSYHFLEEQFGFPNFEVRQAMYDLDKKQREIKDPYAIKKEEIEKRSAAHGGMEEL